MGAVKSGALPGEMWTCHLRTGIEVVGCLGIVNLGVCVSISRMTLCVFPPETSKKYGKSHHSGELEPCNSGEFPVRILWMRPIFENKIQVMLVAMFKEVIDLLEYINLMKRESGFI